MSINELLLVYRKLGIYVNYSTGLRTRHRELMWSALPITTAYTEPYLLVYTKTSIDIYEVSLGIWLQSLPLSNTLPLTYDGSISLSYDPEVINDYGKLIHIISLDRLTRSLNISEKHSRSSIVESTDSPRFEHSVSEKDLQVLSRSTFYNENDRNQTIDMTKCKLSDSNESLTMTRSSFAISNGSTSVTCTTIRLVRLH